MILVLFWALFIISSVLIALGMFFSEWRGTSMVGFTFLFLLSLIILQGNLEVEKGSSILSNYTYSSNGTVTSSAQTVLTIYNPWTDSSSHTIGYFLAIISFVGFAGILITLRGKWK